MTAKQLLKFIESIKEVEELDYIRDDITAERNNCAVLALEKDDKKAKRQFNDLSEKLEAITMMKFQRTLLFKLAGF